MLKSTAETKTTAKYNQPVKTATTVISTIHQAISEPPDPLHCTPPTWMFRTTRLLTPTCVSVEVTRLVVSSNFHSLSVVLWNASHHVSTAKMYFILNFNGLKLITFYV